MFTNQKTKILLLFVLAIIAAPGFATKNKPENEFGWKLARKKNDISIYYRWIEQDGYRSREMKAEFTIDSEIQHIVDQFKHPQSYLKWAAGIRECSIQKSTDSIWFIHTIMSYPRPFKQKDLVTKHTVKELKNFTLLEIEASPDFVAKIKGIKRIQNYRGVWQFSKNQDGQTRVDYRVISFEEPLLPRFIQDPVIQNLCIVSFEKLKELAETK